MAQLGRNTYLFDIGVHNCSRRSYLWPLELVQEPFPERTWQQKQSDRLPFIIDTGDNNHRQHSPITPPRSELTFRSLALCDRHYAHCYCTWPFPQTTAHPDQRTNKIIPLPLLILSRCQARQTLEISVEIRCISESDRLAYLQGSQTLR